MSEQTTPLNEVMKAYVMMVATEMRACADELENAKTIEDMDTAMSGMEERANEKEEDHKEALAIIDGYYEKRAEVERNELMRGMEEAMKNVFSK